MKSKEQQKELRCVSNANAEVQLETNAHGIPEREQGDLLREGDPGVRDEGDRERGDRGIVDSDKQESE